MQWEVGRGERGQKQWVEVRSARGGSKYLQKVTRPSLCGAEGGCREGGAIQGGHKSEGKVVVGVLIGHEGGSKVTVPKGLVGVSASRHNEDAAVQGREGSKG